MFRMFKISIPVVMERSVICLGHVTFASLIAKLGVVSLATHSIAIQAEQAFYAPGYGFQSAASTLVGNAVGEKMNLKLKNDVSYMCNYFKYHGYCWCFIIHKCSKYYVDFYS